MDFGDVRVVSFDLFDTLLVRPFEDPTSILHLLEPRVRTWTSGKLLQFHQERQASKQYVRGREGEEVPLVQRYQALQERWRLTDEERARLLEAELETEARLLRANEPARHWFQRALAADKRVCIVSDTFHSRAFIERVLRQAGFVGWHELYLSSEIGLLKQSGRLFTHVLREQRVLPAQMLHIGDDEHSDIRRAEDLGIRTVHLPRPSAVFARRARGASSFRYRNPLGHSLIRGLLAHRVASTLDEAKNQDLFVGASVEQLGYSLFGPMLFGFTSWLARSARARGIDHVYFLARDGDVMRRAYETMRRHVELPDSTYLYASRRCTSVPALLTGADVLELLEIPFSSMPLAALLHQRFGLDPSAWNELSCHRFGFPSWQSEVTWRADRARLRRLLAALTPTVLQCAELERGQLLAYYQSVGLTEAERPLLVDIGHHGSLQRAIAKLIPDCRICGHYFATSSDASALEALPHQSYLDPLRGSRDFREYEARLMLFELLFLNSERSIVRIDRRGTKWVPHRGPKEPEARRVFARALHRGALRFVHDSTEVLAQQSLDVVISPGEAIAPYLAFLRNPTAQEARLFARVQLENAYSGRPELPVVGSDANSARSPALWPEGTRALTLRPLHPAPRKLLELLQRGEHWLARSSARRSVRKVRKLLRDPRGFLDDSRYRTLRSISKRWPRTGTR